MREGFDDLFNINPKYSTTIGFILGIILTSNLTSYEQNTLGNWLMLIAQTIITNASSQNLIESRINGNIININSKEAKCIYDPPIYDINKAREIINKLYPNNNTEIQIIKKCLDELNQKIQEIEK